MWDRSELEDEDDWESLRQRRAGPIRVIAILIVAAMVLALVIPALLRALQNDEPEEPQPGGVRVAIQLDYSSPSSAAMSRAGAVLRYELSISSAISSKSASGARSTPSHPDGPRYAGM